MKKNHLVYSILVLFFLAGPRGFAQDEDLDFSEDISNAQESSPEVTTDELSLPNEPMSAEAPPAESAPPSPSTTAQDEFSIDSEPTSELTSEPTTSEPVSETASPTPQEANPAPKPDPVADQKPQEETPPPTLVPQEEVPAPVIAEPEMPKSQPAPVVANDDPDFRTEKRFHDIYQKFNQQPTSTEEWSKVTSGKSSQNYEVQKGDTLWDLSKTLFGDPNYWPKIWSLNKANIYNPHEINPQLTVQFYPGSVDQPPTLGVTEKTQVQALVATNSDPVAAQASVSEQEKALANVPDRPAPRTLVPVLKQIPPSFPKIVVKAAERTTSVEMDLRPQQVLNPLVSLSTYLSESEVIAAGVVKETEMGLGSAYEFQYIYVQIEGTPQKTYTVVKTRPGPKGISAKVLQVEVLGEIEILDRVSNDNSYYRAVVKKSLTRVEVGGILIPGGIPRVDIAKTNPNTTGLSEVVGGQFGEGNDYFMVSSFLFLNKGENQGIQVGQTLPVYKNSLLRIKKTLIQTNEELIGYVKVVHANSESATACVIKASSDIRVGDYVGAKWAGAASANFHLEGIPSSHSDSSEKPAGSDSGESDELAL